MTDINEAFDIWVGSLRKWVMAIRTYISEIGTTGQRAHPSEWPRVLEVLTTADDTILAVAEYIQKPLAHSDANMGQKPLSHNDANISQQPSHEINSVSELMKICDVMEDTTRQLVAIMTILTSEVIKNALTYGMSRTYSENLRVYLRTMVDSEIATNNCRRNALAAAPAAGVTISRILSTSALRAVYSAARLRGGLSTEVYVSALVCGGSASFLSEAKDAALGLPPDTIETAIADSAILSEYHPIQAMCYFVQPLHKEISASQAPVFAERREIIDLALPQAKYAIQYELDLLTDRRRALQFGQLATTVSGLNYRLVERLRTIQASKITPVAALEEHTSRAKISDFCRGLCLGGSRFEVTMDRGANTIATRRSNTWAPFAGCKPRALAYAEASGVIIHAAITADEWDPDTGARYSKLANADALPIGEGSSDIILTALVTELSVEYDLHPPTLLKHLRTLVIGDEFAIDGYLARALSRVGEVTAEESLRHELAAVGVVKVPYADLSREIRVTQMRLSLSAAQVMWGHLRDTFLVDANIMDLSPPQRKASLIAGVRRAAEMALRKGPLTVSPPTLKIYAASRWLAPRGYSTRVSAKK